MPDHELRAKLTAIQRREKLTDLEMARRLGVSRSHWTVVRNGGRIITTDLALRAAGAFPELTRELLDLASRTVPVPDATPEVTT